MFKSLKEQTLKSKFFVNSCFPKTPTFRCFLVAHEKEKHFVTLLFLFLALPQKFDSGVDIPGVFHIYLKEMGKM